MFGRAADGRRRGHHPGCGAAISVSTGFDPGLDPGSGGHRTAGQWTLHGHEEAPGGCSRTFPPASSHGHTLQSTAGSGHPKEVGSNTERDVGGLCQHGSRPRSLPALHTAALDHGAASVLRHSDKESGATRAALTPKIHINSLCAFEL